MSPLRRAFLTLAVIVGGCAVYFSVRLALVEGWFAGKPAVSPGLCRAVGQGLGAQDLEVDAAHNALLIAAADSQGGIYWLKLDAPGAAPVKVQTRLKDFHPGGIALYRGADGAETLYAINRRARGRQAIEIFALSYVDGAPQLTQQSSIESGALASPHDLTVVGPERFYVTNDHGRKAALGRFAEDWLLLPFANLVSFNGQTFGAAVTRIASATGVAATPDGQYLYVSAANDRGLLAFRREPFLGTVTEIGSLALPARLGDIAVDAGGNMIVTGAVGRGSQVFRVSRGKDGVPSGYQTIFSDDGGRIAGAGSGAVWNHHLFVGSPDKILDCAIK
jgi:arylesterase/paraoxonase